MSPAHAIRCEGMWVTARDVGKRSQHSRRVHYVNVQTDDYCLDKVILASGLIVETWDGRTRDEWRPHSYVEGERVNCISKMK